MSLKFLLFCFQLPGLHCECPHLLSFMLLLGQKISPEGKAKIQLQLVLHAGDTTNFHFSNESTAVKERDAVKDLLQQLLPKFKRKANKELEEKNRWEWGSVLSLPWFSLGPLVHCMTFWNRATIWLGDLILQNTMVLCLLSFLSPGFELQRRY